MLEDEKKFLMRMKKARENILSHQRRKDYSSCNREENYRVDLEKAIGVQDSSLRLDSMNFSEVVYQDDSFKPFSSKTEAETK